MGGIFSTRWDEHRKAITVEECRELDLGLLAREGAFQHRYPGTVHWSRGQEVISSIAFLVLPASKGLLLMLDYRFGQSAEPIKVPVALETMALHFGGVRWWGRCPLVMNGVPCTRRVRKLYLPPGGRYFGCRTCYRLSYRSVQEHDKRVDVLVRNPEAFELAYQEFMTQPSSQKNCTKAVLLMKASAKLKRFVD
jgi:hypothetical protein